MADVPLAIQISIHAPRTGSDAEHQDRQHPHQISIHAPRTGSDDCADSWTTATGEISIHAPRTGSDDAAPH